MDAAAFFDAMGDYGFEDSSTDTKLRALQAAVREIERKRPWPFLQRSLTLTFDGSSDTPTNVPSQLRAVLRMKDLTNGRRVKYVRLDDFEDIVGTDYSKAGAPILYYFDGGDLKVWPIPPSTTTMKMRYLTRTGQLASNATEADILIPAQYHEDVVLLAAIRQLAIMEDDPDIAAAVEAHYKVELDWMVEDAFREQYDQPEYVHVVDPDDLYSDDLY